MVRKAESDAAMEKRDNEFLKYLCYLYMIALLVALPLHTGGNYWRLGERKYELFQRVSLLCLGCWIVGALLERIGFAVRRRKEAVPGNGAGRGGRASFSKVDWAVAGYGVCVLLSALCSGYGRLAWEGYEGWRMGAVAQLMFVGIYFFVSRRYDGNRIPLYLGEAAVCLVTLFGLLHRLGIDPLGLLAYWSQGDWEYSHMLSTLGNINWLCGYYSVALALLAAHYLETERRWAEAFLYVAALAAFVLLGVQGSQGGHLILAVCVILCMSTGWGQTWVRRKMWRLLTGFFLGMSVMGLLMELRSSKAAVVEDGDVFRQAGWPVWIIGAVVCGAMYFLFVRRGEAAGRLLRRRGVRAVLICVMAGGIAAAVFYVVVHGIDDEFGSGRGFLWRISMEGFRQADLKGMLLGAGPDCYGEEIYGLLGAGTSVWQGTHWDGAVYTNAHNEVLTQLCNVGILGTVSYLAIFLTGWVRYAPWGRRDSEAFAGEGIPGRPEVFDWLGPLAIAMYGIHSLISFQQVLNTPLLFLVLGVCEQRARARRESKEA